MQTFDQFIASYPEKKFSKGQTILLKNEIPRGVYIIERGSVKTYSIGPDGEEQIVSISTMGEDLPIGLASGLIKHTMYFYEAYSDCSLRLIPADEYMNHLETHPASLIHRHIRVTGMLLTALTRIEALEQPKASDKVARTLLYMSDKIGIRVHPKRLDYKISITQQQIANSMGLTRETAAAILKKLELRRLIVRSRNSYILYSERIKKHLDDNDNG